MDARVCSERDEHNAQHDDAASTTPITSITSHEPRGAAKHGAPTASSDANDGLFTQYESEDMLLDLPPSATLNRQGPGQGEDEDKLAANGREGMSLGDSTIGRSDDSSDFVNCAPDVEQRRSQCAPMIHDDSPFHIFETALDIVDFTDDIANQLLALHILADHPS